ncbi:NAD(P)-dependent oxidoreductase [Inquilinus sp.]|jgi:uroporphyrin-III C-methyltransferase/precorrin-2 dehydrogenase/sirohydrochlorin ferrochelatase|uniref:precorrin-2 dehydrogenase/sirohydrochlorin ferrochelatase family protein n=1 Tax=Inquilinus sp. TaxID=1932117 RepID=UPI003782D5D0
MPPSPPPADALLHLPVFLTVRGRVCVVVGGSEAALPKLELLRRAGAAIRLVALRPAPELIAAATAAGAELPPGPLTIDHLRGACLVIDASGDDRTNRHSVALARQAGVPVNVVDRPALCDFILPAILDRSPLVVAFSTGGAAPALAGLIRQELEALIPPGLGRLVALSGRLRHEIRQRIADPDRRLAFWRHLYRHGAPDRAAALDLLERVAEAAPLPGSLTRIAVGPGGVQDLTLRSLAALRRADILLLDGDVDPEVLDHARRDAARRPDAGTPAAAAALRADLDRGLQVVRLVADAATRTMLAAE